MPTYYNLWGASNAINIEIPNDIFPNQAWLNEQEELFNHGQWVRNKTRVRNDATDGISTILRDVTLLLS